MGLSRLGRDPASPARRAGDTHIERWTDGQSERERTEDEKEEGERESLTTKTHWGCN